MSHVWTVARHTISESIRMKIAVFFIVLLAVLLLGLPFASKGDDSVSGAVQAFLAYSVTATSFFLSCLAIFLSKLLSDDMTGKQILMLMTKPLARWQYVLGKWLGIVLLTGMILAIAGAAIYGMTMYLASKTPRDDFDRERLENQILQARHAAQFIVPDFNEEAAAQYEVNLEQGVYANSIDFDAVQEKENIRALMERRWRAVWPEESRVFHFEDVRCDRSPDSRIHIRYFDRVANWPPDEILRCQWVIGDRDKDTAEYFVPRRDVLDRIHTVSVPADAVAADNTLRVEFININPYIEFGETQHPNSVVFEADDSVEVLFSVSSFGSNLIRALALVMCRIMFLAALAVAATTVFSFPVASLVALSVYVLASVRGFLGDSVDWIPSVGVGGIVQTVLHLALRGVYFLVPDFSRFDGLSVLIDGRNVTLKWVLLGLGQLVCMQTAVLLLIACLLFHRREVSEISV